MTPDDAAVAAIAEADDRCPDCGFLSCLCFDDDDPPYDDDGLDDCHMGPDGYCGAAGSEYCDWECPLPNVHFGAPLSDLEETR